MGSLLTGRAARRFGPAVGAMVVLRGAWRNSHALIEYRASSPPMSRVWSVIPGIRGDAPARGDVHLCLHARVWNRRPALLPPAVLVHGWGIGSSYFVPLAWRLASEAPVYAPDLPGHGPSDHDVRPLSITELAHALARWMDAQRVRSALVIGHSLGCQVAAELAAARPDLAAGLLLIGPVPDPAARTRPRQLARALRTAMFERSTLGLWAALDYTRAGASVLRREMDDMLAHRLEPALARVTQPVRIVRGGRDYLAPQPWAERVARQARAPAPSVIPGWGHAVHYDDPDGVARIALAFAHTIVERRACSSGSPASSNDSDTSGSRV